MQVPYMLNGFHPVIPYKNEKEDDDDSNDNGLINIDGLNLNDGVEESPV